MSDERDLDAFAERLDAAFAATRPPSGFERELLARLRRRRWWEQPGAGQLAGVAAAAVIVVGAGFLLVHAPAHGGGASTASRAGAPAAGADTAVFGPLPRPQSGAPAAASTDQPARGAAVLAPAATPAPVALPARAPVLRYAEPAAADADAFASAHGAHAVKSPSPVNLYQGDGFTLSILPTNPGQGLEPSFVMTPLGREPDGSGPDPATAQADAQRFLDAHQLSAPAPSRVEASVTANAPTVVRWVAQVGSNDVVSAAGTPVGLAVIVKADGTVFQASGPLPLHSESADYPLTSYAELARAAGPGFDRARLVYVVAFDGRYGYLEPAVLFTGPGRSVIVPAVAANDLR